MVLCFRIIFFVPLALLVFSCSHQGAIQTDAQPQITLPSRDKIPSASLQEQLDYAVVQAKEGDQQYRQFIIDDLFLKASSALVEENYQQASLIFSYLVKLRPQDDYINTKYAVSLIRSGELLKSQKILEKLYAKQQGEDVRIAMVLAGVHGSLGEVEKAQNIYEKILKKKPDELEACVFLGKSYDVQGDFKKARELLTKCEKQHPESGIFSYYMGKMYIDRGDLKKAQKYFKRSLRRESDFSQSALALGLIEEEKANISGAIKVYENYLEKYPQDNTILNRLVQLLFAEEDFAKVVIYAERLSDIEPSNLNLKVKLGILYTDLGRVQEAINVFKDLLDVAPGSDKILYYLGAIHQEIARYEEAIEYYSQIEPESALFLDGSIQVANMLSALSVYGEQKEQRQKQLIEFVEQRQRQLPALKVELYVIVANFYESVKEYQKAIKFLEQVEQEALFTNHHRYFLATLYEEQKQFDKSEKLIKDIIAKDPEDAHAWNFLGYSLLERNENLDLALEYIQKAVELSPEDGHIRDSLGWYYYKVGKIDKAMKELLFAVEQEPQDVVISKHVAIVYQAKKEFEKAKQFFVSALQNSSLEAEKEDIFHHLKRLEEAQRLPASRQGEDEK